MQTRTCTFMLCAIAMVIIAEKALAQDIQNPLSKAQELGNKTLSLPQVTEPKRKPFLSPPSPVADRNDLGGEKVKATICLQGGKPRELLPNVLGLFHRILMPAEGTMQIKVTYLDGDPGDALVLQAEDGGNINGDKIVTKCKLDKSSSISFRFKTTQNLGVYHVTVRKGWDEKVFDFWVGPEHPLQTSVSQK